MDSDKVVNISTAVGKKFVRFRVEASDAKLIREKFRISRPFLLYVSSFEERKNQRGLIEVFASLPQATRRRYQLVLVGNAPDGIAVELKELGFQLGLSHEDIVDMTEKIDDHDLVPLDNLCHFSSVFPSFIEGFGIPVL